MLAVVQIPWHLEPDTYSSKSVLLGFRAPRRRGQPCGASSSSTIQLDSKHCLVYQATAYKRGAHKEYR
ncbi:hypothetical protein INR49_029443, partial [Caranx melampygus]